MPPENAAGQGELVVAWARMLTGCGSVTGTGQAIGAVVLLTLVVAPSAFWMASGVVPEK